MVKRQNFQQAWVCLSCLSEVEANILTGFEYSEVSLLAQWLFRHGLKSLQVKFKAKTILTLVLSVIWWNHLILG